MSRKNISAALRKAVWIHYNGKEYQAPCYTGCGETITVHNYECGHVIADSKGGAADLPNLRPVCSNCNKSMGHKNMEEFIESSGFKKGIKQTVDDISLNEPGLYSNELSDAFCLMIKFLLSNKEMA